MKIKFYTSLCILLFCLTLMSQNNYYYYNGKKNNLIIDEDFSSGNNISFSRGDNIDPIQISEIFYIKLKKPSDLTILKQTANQKNATVLQQNKFMPLWYKLKLNDRNNKSSLEICNEIYETGFFADVDPAFMFDFSNSCSNDDDFKNLWGLKNSKNPNIDINICDAWTINEGNGVNVAVVDHGIDKSNNDLNNNISPISYDTQNGNSTSVFENGRNHGTHVAGTSRL